MTSLAAASSVQHAPAAPDTATWPVLSTTAALVVSNPRMLSAAREIVEPEPAAVDLAASRFRADSELANLHLAGGRPQRISPLLADLLGTALRAARHTGGAVDPTLGDALAHLG